MAGYIGTKAVNLSTTGADIAGDADVSGALDVGSGLTVDNDGSTVLTVDRATSDGAIIDLKKSGSSVGSIGVRAGDNIYIHSPHNGIEFTNTDFRPIDGNGNRTDGIVDVGDGSNRFKDLYLSGGVVFDAVAGNATSNTLDDYEEGTWNLGVAASGITLTAASTATGRYTKIGNSVTVHCLVTPASATSSSSNFDITGLPFAPTNSAVGAVMSQYVQDAGQQIVCFVPGNSSVIRFYETDSGAWNRLKHSDITTNSDMYITVTYMTS